MPPHQLSEPPTQSHNTLSSRSEDTELPSAGNGHWVNEVSPLRVVVFLHPLAAMDVESCLNARY